MIGHYLRAIAATTMVVAGGSSAAIAQSGLPFGPHAPAVPAKLEPPDGFTVFFRAHAIGTQNYMCLPSAAGAAWKQYAPQATLYQTFRDEMGQQLATHFLSANPDEPGLARPTWQHSFDSSRVWARQWDYSVDSNYVAPGAIPWLVLLVVGKEDGPEGGSFLTRARWIQRVNTSGGVAPSTGCSQASEIGTIALVPYEADYFFYKAPRQ
jgi:hypothetical protein